MNYHPNRKLLVVLTHALTKPITTKAEGKLRKLHAKLYHTLVTVLDGNLSVHNIK